MVKILCIIMKTTLAYPNPRAPNLIKLALFCAALGMLTACQTTGDEPVSETVNLPLFGQSKQQAAEALETQGNYRGAADIWLALANKNTDLQQGQRDQYPN